MILLDNSVAPGIIVSLDIRDEDALLDMIEKYQRANNRMYDVTWYASDFVAVLTAPLAKVPDFGNFPSRPMLFTEPPAPVEVLPGGTDMSPELLAIEAEAYAKMGKTPPRLVGRDEEMKEGDTIGETPTE